MVQCLIDMYKALGPITRAKRKKEKEGGKGEKEINKDMVSSHHKHTGF